jgi:hypothetical protein
MAYGGRLSAKTMSCAVDAAAAGFTKTQIRRLQRRYVIECLEYKVKQQAASLQYACATSPAGDTDALTMSVAVHKIDCRLLERSVHFASHANQQASAAGLKSKTEFTEHRMLHQRANAVKHEHGNLVELPPCPPPMSMIACRDLEEFRSTLFNRTASDDCGGYCDFCNTWQPILSKTMVERVHHAAELQSYTGSYPVAQVTEAWAGDEDGAAEGITTMQHIDQSTAVSGKFLPDSLPAMTFTTIQEAGRLSAASPNLLNVARPALSLLNAGQVGDTTAHLLGVASSPGTECKVQ